MPTPCFMVSRTIGRVMSLRRYADGECSSNGSYHNASVEVARYSLGTPEQKALYVEWMIPTDTDTDPDWDLMGYGWSRNTGPLKVPEVLARPEWPKTCACGYTFADADGIQLNLEVVWARDDTGEVIPGSPNRAGFPPGAMYFSPWYDRLYKPQLEHCLCVTLPNGNDWCIDSQANNCTIPDDHRQEQHHCWSIEGTPPNITAGKIGPTCSAGAGSILSGDYHGFLQNGVLT